MRMLLLVRVRKLLAVSCVIAAGLVLTGCETAGTPGLVASSPSGQGDVQALADPRGVTGPASDPMEAAKEQYRERNFGLSEQKFRLIVEKDASNSEGWLGLAASYDQLRRFDLADRAYEQVAKLAGESAILHNNRGYSYLLRGNRARAQAEFARARRLDPGNDYVRNNMSAMAARR